jgi:hypothetical protein
MNSYQPITGSFDHLRQVVHPALAGLPAFQLREQVDGEFGEGTAEAIERDLEGVFDGFGRMLSSAARDLGRFAQRAAPIAAHIGGGVLQGAMAGSAAGLPGIIAGAALGGAGAGLSRYGSGTARDVGRAMSGVTSLAGQFTPMGQAGSALGSTLSGLGAAVGGNAGKAAPAQAGARAAFAGQAGARHAPAATGAMTGAGGSGAGGMGALTGMLGNALGSPQAAGVMNSLFGGSGAAGQLASTIQRPEVQQALAAIRLGALGRPAIPVGAGGTSVPTAAFAQLLGHLIGEVAAEMAETASESSAESAEFDFMRGASGEFIADPASVSDRAGRLWALLNESQAERFAESMAMEAAAPESGEAEAEAETEASEDEGWQEGEAEWEAWQSEQEFLDSLDLAEAEAIDAALSSEELSYAW